MSGSTLLHSTSLRGHRDCFEKYHLIANQKLSRAKGSRSAYEGVKSAFSQKISRIVQYAQNREAAVAAASESARRGGKHQLLCCSPQGDRTLVPQSDSHVPRYAPRWAEAAAARLPGRGEASEEMGLTGGCGLWAGGARTLHLPPQQGGGPAGLRQHRHTGLSREEREYTACSLITLHFI